ncbi:hypothetical protein A1Q_3987 [Vibrio campbellii HY01]|nr:hypothetical protein A1Q_3987 [Vibrio campbellii HY01]
MSGLLKRYRLSTYKAGSWYGSVYLTITASGNGIGFLWEKLDAYCKP